MKQEEIFKEAEKYINDWIKADPTLESEKDELMLAFVDGANWVLSWATNVLLRAL